MHVSVLNSRESLYNSDANRIMLPCEDGAMCVLDFHQPFLCALKKGYLMIEGKWEQKLTAIPIQRGLAKMVGNEFVAMVE